MSGNTCTCGGRFLDPEDWRDHMPCPGTRHEQEIAGLESQLLAVAKAAMLRAVEIGRPEGGDCEHAFGDEWKAIEKAAEDGAVLAGIVAGVRKP